MDHAVQMRLFLVPIEIQLASLKLQKSTIRLDEKMLNEITLHRWLRREFFVSMVPIFFWQSQTFPPFSSKSKIALRKIPESSVPLRANNIESNFQDFYQTLHGHPRGRGPGFVDMKTFSHKIQRHLFRVADDSWPGRLIDSKIMDKLKILVIILCHDHAVVVDWAKNRLELIVDDNRVKKSGRDHDP